LIRLAVVAVAAVVLSTALAADAPYPGMQPLARQFAIDIAEQRVEGGWAC
jgi:hypothetical protein